MVDNGLARGRAFDVAAVEQRWLDLFEQAAQAYEPWLASRGAWPVRYARHLRRMSAQKARARRFRRREREDKRASA